MGWGVQRRGRRCNAAIAHSHPRCSAPSAAGIYSLMDNSAEFGAIACPGGPITEFCVARNDGQVEASCIRSCQLPYEDA